MKEASEQDSWQGERNEGGEVKMKDGSQDRGRMEGRKEGKRLGKDKK